MRATLSRSDGALLCARAAPGMAARAAAAAVPSMNWRRCMVGPPSREAGGPRPPPAAGPIQLRRRPTISCRGSGRVDVVGAGLNRARLPGDGDQAALARTLPLPALPPRQID